MKIEKEYYVIAIYDNYNDVWYYYVNHEDDKIILTKNVERAMKASVPSICNSVIEGMLRCAETCYLLDATGDRVNCTKYCSPDGDEFNLFLNEIELANSISVKSVSAKYSIDSLNKGGFNA